MSIAPAGLQCITAYQLESKKFEAFVGIAHMRTHNLTEHIRLATTSGARTRAPQQCEFQKRFGTVVPSNGKLVANLLNVGWLKSHFPDSLPRNGGFLAAKGDLEVPLPCCSLTKDSRTHAHQRCVFLDCDGVIVCHAHRKLRQFQIEFVLE